MSEVVPIPMVVVQFAEEYFRAVEYLRSEQAGFILGATIAPMEEDVKKVVP
jgi:hypothetical protein